jgi:opacity protein-like surface antigen
MLKEDTMMKRLSTITALVCLVALAAPPAFGASVVGTVFGSLWSAQPIGPQAGALGFNLGIADATSVFGSFTYGLGEHWDGRLKLGLIDDDNMDPKLAFGADLKYTFLDAGGPGNNPVDMSLGGILEMFKAGPYTVMQLGASFLASRDFVLANGNALTPYAAIGLRLERISWEIAGDDKSDSDLEFGFNLGVRYEMTRYISLYGELQLDGNDGLFIGLDYLVL